jgi:hypothetical protein
MSIQLTCEEASNSRPSVHHDTPNSTQPVDDRPISGLIEARGPRVFVTLVYGYPALWFTTPFFGASLVPARARTERLS